MYGLSLFWAVFALVFHDEREYLILAIYLIVNIVNYVILRYVLRHKDQFAFLGNDSESSLQDTRIYKNLRDLGDAAVFALKGLVGLFLVLSIFAISNASMVATSFAVVTLVGGGVLLYLTRDPSNHFVLAFLYLTGIMLVALVERSGSATLLGSLQIGGATNLLFALMAPLVALKIIFKHPEELFLSTPLDFLILAMSVSLVVVSPEMTLTYHLPWVIGKAIVLFLALKIIAVGTAKRSHQVCTAMLATLCLVIVRIIA
jgi:UDP-GlcNAc:undecaprenyl-phosphate GlcNAc-1-phosphate transferase